MNGTLHYGDLLIEWDASYDDSDGFTWVARAIRGDGSDGYTLAELAEGLIRHHDDIDREVRSAFNQACAEHNENMHLSAAGF